MHFWDWRTGYNFQRLQAAVQPGSLDSEAGIFAMTFDLSSSRLITCEADKTVKIYKEDDSAVSINSLYGLGMYFVLAYTKCNGTIGFIHFFVHESRAPVTWSGVARRSGKPDMYALRTYFCNWNLFPV